MALTTSPITASSHGASRGLAATRALVDWLARSGARFPALALDVALDGERLVRATRDIDVGEVVLAVPRSCLVTTDVARASAGGRALSAAAGEPVSSQLALAAFLLSEARARRSRFAPYLRALPAAFPGVPLFHDPATLALLRGSLALRKLEERRAALVREHASLVRARPFSGVPLDVFLRARTAVVSRVFAIHVAGEKGEALVPLADMMNHSPAPDVDWEYDDGAGELVMTAVRPVRAGQEVRDSYGRKCNSRFFVNYGFALADNPDDEALVELTSSTDDIRYSRKAALLGGAARAFQITARVEDDGTQAALEFLRIACASESELARIDRLLSQGAAVPPLSARNEAAALALFGRACERALARFDTTIAQDDALLARQDLSRAERLCVLVRRGEKRVLAHHAMVAAAAVPLLRLPAPSLARALAARRDRDALTRSLRAVALPFTAPAWGSSSRPCFHSRPAA